MDSIGNYIRKWQNGAAPAKKIEAGQGWGFRYFQSLRRLGGVVMTARAMFSGLSGMGGGRGFSTGLPLLMGLGWGFIVLLNMLVFWY